jgi:hypothetical protein
MGDHPNGPSKVLIDSSNQSLCKIIDDEEFVKKFDGQVISISELFQLNAEKFLGKKYLDRFVP